MRLVLADDHHLFREALCYYLRLGMPDVEVIEASSLGEALEAAEACNPDAVLLDFIMPGMGGLSSIRRAVQCCARIPVVLLSGNLSYDQATTAMSNGVAAVISKDLTGDGLTDALRRILSGERLILSPSWPQAWKAPGVDSHRTSEDKRVPFNLTARETDVVRLLADGHGDKLIAEQLRIAGSTVRLHLHHAFRKMGARNRLDALRIALQSGLVKK